MGAADHPETEILITSDDGREEQATVTRVVDYTLEYPDDFLGDAGDEFWILEGIDPYDAPLIPHHYVWLSGSFQDPRSREPGKFPLVYVPKAGKLTITEGETDR